MAHKTMREFIKEHRTELDDYINAVMFRYDGNGGHGTIPYPAPRYNDNERREWIANDEGLYYFALSEGVKL